MSLSRHQAVGAYRLWSPPAFDAEDETPHDSDTAQPGTSADGGSGDVDEADGAEATPAVQLPTADEIEAMFEQAREEGRAIGHEEGHAAGYEEGLAQARADNQATAEQLAQLVTAMDQALDALDGDIATELATLALALARQLAGAALTARPEAVAATVREALQHMPHNKVRVRLNPEDIALVREHLADQLEHGHHQLVDDPGVARGGCVLEAAGCEVDATLQTRWRRIVEGLGRDDSSWDVGDA